MTLYIDMIAFYLQKAGGITVVWKELISRMLRDGRDIVLILQNEECHNIYLEQIMDEKPQVIYEQSGKWNRYQKVKCPYKENAAFISTYYRVPSNTHVKQYVLVHDFTYEYYVKGVKKLVHAWQKKKAVAYADTVICVSQNTLNDLLKFYPWAKNKEKAVIYNGVSENYRHVSDSEQIDELGNYNREFYLLYVGSRARYKRFDYAVSIAAETGYGLVIIGGGTLNKQELNSLKSKLGEKYLHLTGISEETLNVIYNKAFALLYPSEYEGFGIPIIEAQRAGCPIIAKAGSSVSEIAGNGSYLLNDYTEEEAWRLIQLYQDYSKRICVIKEGYENAEKYSWEKTYESYCNLIF